MSSSQIPYYIQAAANDTDRLTPYSSVTKSWSSEYRVQRVDEAFTRREEDSKLNILNEIAQ